ncbi:MAG TPA: sigma-70 family RNA polymerase sigma factor [Thermoanaerobaculia bacterium]|nr:sigma-70 family RNA polymerase sigma factor [Thermoanaerobaculia bacterium]
MDRDLDELTSLLQAWSGGDAAAEAKLLPLVYDQLRRQAAHQLRRERPGHSLSPTTVVHELYLRLVEQERAAWVNRAQFFAVASRLIRRVLVDHARERLAAKRAGGWQRVTLAEEVAGVGPRDVDMLALDEALAELQAMDPRRARLVELRYFGGLDLEETAAALEVSTATVSREWQLARAWLHRRLATETSV